MTCSLAFLGISSLTIPILTSCSSTNKTLNTEIVFAVDNFLLEITKTTALNRYDGMEKYYHNSLTQDNSSQVSKIIKSIVGEWTYLTIKANDISNEKKS